MHPHPHQLLMTAYPPGPGPYERYELTVQATGEVLLAGPMPFDRDAVQDACQAYGRRVGLLTAD